MATITPTLPDLVSLASSEPQLKFERTFPFDNKKQQSNCIQVLSGQVSELFSVWLKEDRHTLDAQTSLAENNTFVCGPEEFQETSITEEMRNSFQTRVAKQVEQFLNPGYHPESSLTFYTGHAPKGHLSKILTESGIEPPPFSLIFPKESCVKITPISRHLKPADEIQVSVDFTAPPPLQPEELKDAVLDPNKNLHIQRTLSFSNIDEQRKALENAANQVADFLSVFLTKEAHTTDTQALLKTKGLSVCDSFDFEDYSITPKKIDAFNSYIQSQIITTIPEIPALNKVSRAQFSSDFVPELELEGALQTSGIFSMDVCNLLPRFLSVSVQLNKFSSTRGEFSIEVAFPHT